MAGNESVLFQNAAPVNNCLLNEGTYYNCDHILPYYRYIIVFFVMSRVAYDDPYIGRCNLGLAYIAYMQGMKSRALCYCLLRRTTIQLSLLQHSHNKYCTLGYKIALETQGEVLNY